MTTLEIGLEGHAPVGWSVSLEQARRGDTFLCVTRDSEAGQPIVPEILISVVELPDVETSLEVLASSRRAVVADTYDEVRLRRGEFVSDRDPEMYGQEISFETKVPQGDRVAIIQSEILVTFPGFKSRVLSFLLTAPESVFEDCALDFRKLFDSILVKESE